MLKYKVNIILLGRLEVMKELPNLITLINSIKGEICYSYINKIVAIDKQYKEMEDI